MFEMAPLGLIFFATERISNFFGSKLIPDKVLWKISHRNLKWKTILQISVTSSGALCGKNNF
jgi:hypothetical protein